MKSAVAKGAYWKGRTRRWLEANGYQVWDMEIVRWIERPGGERFAIKRDQIASDLAAMNRDEIVFVQVKGGATRRSNLAAAKQEFAKFAFPAGTKQWIVCWAPQARQPEVIPVSEGPCGEVELRCVPTRRKQRADLPLFASAR